MSQNRPASVAERPWLFKPGQSGNPGGRPKAADDVQAIAREHTPEAIRTLVRVLSSKNERAAVAAATALLDRAWGKPLQPLRDESGNTPVVQHLLAAQIISRELVLELASQPAPATAQPTQPKVVDLALIPPPTE
jgi:hypothetical protein